MELLKFNKLGQWDLVKDKENSMPEDYDHNSYRPIARQGSLSEDRGVKGLRSRVTSRAPKNNSKNKMLGQVPFITESAYADRSPGIKPV